MRLALVVGLVAASLGGLLAPSRAVALSCARSQWAGDGRHLAVSEELPVNARPWLFPSCRTNLRGCTLESGGVSKAVDIVPIRECVSGDAGYIVELAPKEPLMPDRAYEIVCEGLDPSAELRFTTRGDAEPAAPPDEIAVADVWIEAGSDACCGSGDRLGLHLEGLDADFIAEGGRVDVAYPDGEVFPVRMNYFDDVDRLPVTEGPIELTPVAADGTRGATIRVESSEIGESGACAVVRRHSLAPWLLAPLLWIGIRRRRRSRAAPR